MGQIDYAGMANFISDNLRLKTFPLSVKFLEIPAKFPEKTRQPSITLKTRITICQGVTLARVYGWTVGLTKEDLIGAKYPVTFYQNYQPKFPPNYMKLGKDLGLF